MTTKHSFTLTLGSLIWLSLLPLAQACGPWLPESYVLRNDDVFYQPPQVGFRYELRHLLPDSVPHQAQLESEPLGGQSSLEALRASLSLAEVTEDAADAIVADYQSFRSHLNRIKYAYEHPGRSAYRDDSDGSDDTPEPISLDALVVPEGLPAEFALYLEAALAYYQGEHQTARENWQAILDLPAAERQQRSVMAAYMIAKACPQAALTYFPLVRELVEAGYPDSQGLAAASYGREARVYLDQGDYQAAIELYLRQWAAGYENAEQSLKLVARDIWYRCHDRKLASLLADETSRAVLTAYLLVQRDDEANTELRERFLRLLPDIEKIHLPEAGRFALMEYQQNNLSAARLWISHAAASDALALWVKSKLLLRAGRIEEGRTLLLALTEDMQASDTDWRRLSPSRAWGELGLLMMREARFVEAADCFWNADSWEDCAYVLERLLSIDELIQWVQSRLSEFGEESDHYHGDPHALLARRLMREGRFELALEHFQPDARQQAEAYLQAMRSANDLSQKAATRARHFWEAACLMREYGMLLFAAELAPDYAWTEGSLEWGDVALARQNRLYSYGNPINEPSGEEVDRAKQTQILPDKRYHYRYRAVRLAELGASLLPNNSEQAARIYCVAGSWIKYRDPSEADRLFKLLVVRCPDTELGQAAAVINWFPRVELDRIQPFSTESEHLSH